MHWSDETPLNSLTDRASASGESCPFLNVVAACENGIVVESQRGFDVGSVVAIGFHVNRNASRSSSFISADTMVVDSHPGVSRTGSPVFRVTLMFANISSEDRDLLMEISNAETTLEEAKAPRFSLN